MKESRMHTGSTEVISRFIKDLKLGEKLMVSAFGDALGPEVAPDDVKILQTLLKQRILVPSLNGYRLNPHIHKLFSSVIDVDRSRYINVNIKSRIPSLELVMNAYIDNLSQQNVEYARESLEDIEQQVFEIVFEAEGAVRSLANRLQTRFGFVRGLREKILENESAITTAGLLVENLTAFSFDRMSDFVHRADNSPELYRIVCVHLLGELARCQSNLNSIMIQLREMLSLFRRERKRTSLLKAFSEKHFKEPSYRPSDYCLNASAINVLFTVAKPLALAGHADLRSDLQLDELCRIVEGLKEANSALPEGAQIDRSPGFSEPPSVKTEEYELAEAEDDIVAYFRCVIASNTPVSAKQYFTMHHLKGALDHWLFAVCAFYEDLSPDNRKGFLEPQISFGFMYDQLDLEDEFLQTLDEGGYEDAPLTQVDDENSALRTTLDDTLKSKLLVRQKTTGFGNRILTDFVLAVNNAALGR